MKSQHCQRTKPQQKSIIKLQKFGKFKIAYKRV